MRCLLRGDVDMNTKLNGCWTNKLVSYVATKEKIAEVVNTCNILETSQYLPIEKRLDLLKQSKEHLMDVYLMLQCIFENETDAIQQRCKTLNCRE